jgi:hypothetical protein
MYQRIRASFTITRLLPVCVALDASGAAICEDQDIDIEGEVSGTMQPADPDVGIMRPYAEDLYFTEELTGTEFDLTEEEEALAQDLLLEIYLDPYDI